jgi:hypothetical protein
MHPRLSLTLLRLFGLKQRKSTVNNAGIPVPIPIDALTKIKALKHFDFYEIIQAIESLEFFTIENDYLLMVDYDADVVIRQWVVNMCVQKLEIVPKGFQSNADMKKFYSQFGLPVIGDTVRFATLEQYKAALKVWTFEDEPIEHHFQVHSELNQVKEFVFEPKLQDRILKFTLESTDFVTHAQLKKSIDSICATMCILWHPNSSVGHVLFKDSDAEKVLRVTNRLNLALVFESITLEEQVLYWELFKEQIEKDKERKTIESKFQISTKPHRKKKMEPKLNKLKPNVARIQKKKKKSNVKNPSDMLQLLESMAV